MKKSRRLLVHVLTVFSTLAIAGGAFANGPTSKLYLTAGANNMSWVVQGPSVVNSWTQHNGNEYPIAVVLSVRTLGDSTGTNGAEYTLGGSFTGTNYPFPFTAGVNVYDGATDTNNNCTVDYSSGNVYVTNANWANPAFLFATATGYLGITYDPTDNTLWLANFNGTTVEHRSLFGTL